MRLRHRARVFPKHTRRARSARHRAPASCSANSRSATGSPIGSAPDPAKAGSAIRSFFPPITSAPSLQKTPPSPKLSATRATTPFSPENGTSAAKAHCRPTTGSKSTKGASPKAALPAGSTLLTKIQSFPMALPANRCRSASRPKLPTSFPRTTPSRPTSRFSLSSPSTPSTPRSRRPKNFGKNTRPKRRHTKDTVCSRPHPTRPPGARPPRLRRSPRDDGHRDRKRARKAR